MSLRQGLQEMEKYSHAERKGHGSKMFVYDAALVVGSRKGRQGNLESTKRFFMWGYR